MSKKEYPIVAVDEGSSRVKLAFITEDGKISSYITTSIAQRDRLTTSDLEFHKGGYTVVNGETYTITAEATNPVSNMTPHMYQVSDVNLAATHYALSEAGFGGQEVTIITSLPVDLFFNSPNSEELVNTTLINQKKASLMREVKPVRDGVKAAKIVNVLVCPEAVTAFPLLVDLDGDGNRVDVEDYEKFVVFDFGESTLDVTLLTADGTITNERFSSDLAVKKVIKELCKTISREEDIDINHAVGAKILKGGKFAGKDISNHIESAVNKVFADISLKVADEIPSLRSASRIYAIGGGAYVFADKLKSIHKCVVVPKLPELTLAISMLSAANAQPIAGRTLEG